MQQLWNFVFAPGDGVDSETVSFELFRAELLFISMLRTDRQLRLFVYSRIILIAYHL